MKQKNLKLGNYKLNQNPPTIYNNWYIRHKMWYSYTQDKYRRSHTTKYKHQYQNPKQQHNFTQPTKTNIRKKPAEKRATLFL